MALVGLEEVYVFQIRRMRVGDAFCQLDEIFDFG